MKKKDLQNQPPPPKVPVNNWEQINDIEISREVIKAFKGNADLQSYPIEIKVGNGWVTLTGNLNWNYQKESAQALVSNLIGVKGITNNISIHAENNLMVDKSTIERALNNHVAIDAAKIRVEASGNDVVLTGTVDTWSEKELAGRIAWKAQGVVNVRNEIRVGYDAARTTKDL